MEAQQQRSILVDYDVPSFSKRVGDVVRIGEIVGRYQQQDVRIPFDGVIESIFCDGQKRIAHLALVGLSSSTTAGFMLA